MIKPIDTYYNGNYFRSRLEARWAVFFDEMGIKYQYEPMGFNLSNKECYLPDFYLPETSQYLEVKPDDFNAYPVTNGGKAVNWEAVFDHQDYHKWDSFSYDKLLVILVGNPHAGPHFSIEPVDKELVAFKKLPCGVWALRKTSIAVLNHNPAIRECALLANKKRFEHL